VYPFEIQEFKMPDDTLNNTPDSVDQKGEQIENHGPGGLDDIVSEIEERAPEVSEHAISAAAEQSIDTESLRDSTGKKFDPEKGHHLGEDGKPVMTPSGRFSTKKKGRKQKTAQKSTVRTKPEVDPNVAKEGKQRAAGVGAANALIGVSMMLGGHEFAPIKNEEAGIDEKENIENAFADYFVAKDMDDIPPGLALSLVLLSYYAPRVAMPKTKEKVKKAGGWFKQKFVAWRTKRELKKHGMEVDGRVTKREEE
jgi:hypothetical protein